MSAPGSALCITADDYGMHAVVNAAIEELAAGGHISAAAVMVHDDAALATLARLRATGVATGLHLVFTQERPLVRELVGSALAPAGWLPASPYALVGALVGRPRLRHLLAAELAAQLERYRSLGLALDFVNSHEHVHECPLLWPLVAELIERAGAPAVRAARAQPITATRQGALTLLSRASWRLRPLRGACRVLSPLGAGQAGHMGLRAVADLVDRGLRWPATDDVLPELVVHPATADAPLHARYGAVAGQRQAELELLRSPELAALWRRRGVTLGFDRRSCRVSARGGGSAGTPAPTSGRGSAPPA